LRGDFGLSFLYNRPVAELLWEHFGLTAVVSISALLFVWMVALPIGILSAVRQYSLSDYATTMVGLVGLAVPNFLLALGLMYLATRYFGLNAGGLFSPPFRQVAWSWARVGDLFAHLWMPGSCSALAGGNADPGDARQPAG